MIGTMTRVMRVLATLLVIVPVVLTVDRPVASAATSTYWFGRTGTNQYDYAPSVMIDGGQQKVWWCSLGNNGYDRIFYKNFQTGEVKQVFPSVYFPEQVHYCDPSVVRGRFSVPTMKHTYSYAMYYTFSSSGLNNRIGVVFSDDGVSWVGKSFAFNPVIPPVSCSAPKFNYGTGQTAAWNRNGFAKVQLFWTDTCANKTYTAVATDGTGTVFGPASEVAMIPGRILPNWNSDFAIDSSAGYLYAAVPDGQWVGQNPKEESQFSVYKMNVGFEPWTSLPGTSGTWQLVYTVNQAVTGQLVNFAPGLLRDGYGNVASTKKLFGIRTFFGADQGNIYTSNLYRSNG